MKSSLLFFFLSQRGRRKKSEFCCFFFLFSFFLFFFFFFFSPFPNLGERFRFAASVSKKPFTSLFVFFSSLSSFFSSSIFRSKEVITGGALFPPPPPLSSFTSQDRCSNFWSNQLRSRPSLPFFFSPFFSFGPCQDSLNMGRRRCLRLFFSLPLSFFSFFFFSLLMFLK